MSMNLTLHVAGLEQPLNQTPTIITYACLYRNGYLWCKPGFNRESLIQDTNESILEKYCFWLMSQYRHFSFDSDIEREDFLTETYERIDKLRALDISKMEWSYI